MIVIWIAFIIVGYFKGINLADIVIGIATVAYSVSFDCLFGTQLGLYHYILPSISISYAIAAAFLIYSILNIIYTIFLPKKLLNILSYTLVWILGMLIFETLSFITHTIVLTGWRVIPWSIVTYVVAYTWIYTLYNYLARKGLDKILIVHNKI